MRVAIDTTSGRVMLATEGLDAWIVGDVLSLELQDDNGVPMIGVKLDYPDDPLDRLVRAELTVEPSVYGRARVSGEPALQIAETEVDAP